MSTVEDRIVSMKFENSAFERSVSTTLGTLAKLKNSLNFSSGAKSLSDLDRAGGRFTMGNVGTTIEGISGRFLTMATVGVTALSNITNKALDTATALGKSLTIDPITGGLKEYETNLNSIQTILANTQASGATLKDVNGTLQELNKYSDKTIYNFSEMASNIGTFTAAGVGLKPATSAIKGIANLAALSGSNSGQASTAMYQLSQAIAAGRVGLQDWNSVVNAGMGGATFQRALATTATQMGKLTDGAVSLEGPMKNVKINGESFRESISAANGAPSWLTDKVLTETLAQFTGDMTDAELAAKGFSAEQIKSIQATAKTAQEAATKVKTLSQLVDVAKETVGSGWAKTWQYVFGDFDEARSSFTKASNTVNGFLNAQSKARNKMLKQWSDLGGRDVAIKAVSNAFKALGSILVPIRDAFREIFPASTGKDLFELTQNVNHFFKSIALSQPTMDLLKRTFAGVFAVVDIGIQIFKGFLSVIGDLLGAASGGALGFLGFTAGIGDFLVKVDESLKKGKGLTNFFANLGDILAIPVQILSGLTSAIFGFFRALTGGLGGDDIVGKISPLAGLGDQIKKSWAGVAPFFSKVGDALAPMLDHLKAVFSGFGQSLADGISAQDFEVVFSAINTALFGGMFLLFKKFFGGGGLNIDFGGGVLGSIKGTFGELTDTLGAMQAQIQAKTLLLIAGAVALLTASVVALSLVDADALKRGLTAMAVGFGQLLYSMSILTKISGTAGVVKIPLIAASLILLAGAMLLLSLSVIALSRLDGKELTRGLLGVAGMMGILVAAVKPLSAASGGMIKAGIAMIPLAAGLLLLSFAVKSMAQLSWEEMAKGLVGVAGGLVIIGSAMNLFPESTVLKAVGLVIVAAALKVLASALKDFADMSWTEMGKGMAGIAGGLLIIAAAMNLMPPSLPLTAAGLVIVAYALGQLAKVAKVFGKMSWKELAKAGAAIAGMLLILAIGLTAMSGSLVGVAALLVAAAALRILTPVLQALGAMSWEAIAKGMAALAGTFLILGVAGLLLAPLTPIILGLALAIALIGAGFALAGVGALALATAFGLFVAAGTAGIAVFIAGVTAIINLLPLLFEKFGEAVVAFAKVLGESAPELAIALGELLIALSETIIKAAPKIADAAYVLIHEFIRVVKDNAPDLVRAGFGLLIDFLEGMKDNAKELTEKAAALIIALADALGEQAEPLAKAALQLLIDFLNGFADAVRDKDEKIREAGLNVAAAIASGMTFGLTDKIPALIETIKNLWNDLIKDVHFNGPSIDLNPLNNGNPLDDTRKKQEAAAKAAAGSPVQRRSTSFTPSIVTPYQQAFSAISAAMSDTSVTSPTITPVLDLTQLKSGLGQIGSLITDPTLGSTSLQQASAIIAAREAAAQVGADGTDGSLGATYNYNQYLSSPKAVDDVSVYRTTRSLFAFAKE